uniref:Cell division protein n=1 Tax=Oedocladium prescottii TaxID=337949 RepID=A0A8K1JA71_9CHLO|nr:cell division protein [Oedocladium prescottii]
MINFYQFKLCKNYKTKLVFYSKNNNERIDILKEGKSYKNLQKIKFNQKQTFTIKKRFTLDWHTRPNFNLISGQISKNQKFLKLASFYSQLNSNNFSKQFTSLMILNLKTKISNIKDVQQPNLRAHTLKGISTLDKMQKLPTSTDTYNCIDHDIFSNLKYKENVWFSKIFMPFSNRNYWWILLPTRSILTRMRWNLNLKQITNRFDISQHSTSSKEYLNSTILFDSFPEFLIEKPIYWYWMLPFFGCIALVSNNLNLSFLKNNNSTYNLQKKVDLNIYSNFYQHQIQNSISWEMFQFFDYKKILFDSSLKYLNKVSLNNDTLLIQIKKSWLSRQKEHYICNYQDNLIQKNFTKNLNQLSQITTIHWWKINWEKVISQQLGLNSIEPIPLKVCVQKNFLLDNFTFNINKNAKFYSFDSLFYSNFFWYWHTLDTRNINDFLNLNYSNLIYKKGLQDNQNFSFQKVLTDYKLTFLYPFSIRSISSFNDCFTINEFPLKIQFPWLFDNLQNNKINQKINYQTNQNFDSIIKKEKRDDIFRDTHTLKGIGSQNNNNKKYPKSLIQFQIRKINLNFKKILDCNFLQKPNFIDIKDSSLFINFKNSTQSRSSFLFCISSKKQSIIKQNELVKQNLQLIKQKAPIYLILNDTHTNISMFDNIKRINKQRHFSNLTLYNGIGCEIFESEFNPIYGWNSTNSFKDICPYTLSNLDQVKHNNLDSYNCIDRNSFKGMGLKKNQSISSFHQASFLLNNFMSKFYFESGLSCLTTQYLINYFYQILNLKNFDKNNNNQLYSTLNYQKNIQIQKNPIVMSGYNYPHLNDLFHKKNQIIKNISNQILINQIRCPLPPNIISNQFKFNNFLKSNQKQYLKTTFHQALNNDSNFSLLTKQNLCIINKKFGKIDSKSKKFEHFVILNLLKNSKTLFSKSKKFQINIKKISYRKEFFKKKTTYKYKTIRPIFLTNSIVCVPLKEFVLCLQNKIFKIKQNKIKLNIINNNKHNSSLLIGYSDSILKEKINSILRDYVFSNQSKIPFFSSTFFSDPSLLQIKREPKRILTFLNYNNIPKYIYVSNKSIFWNYINSTYNSSGLLNTTKPFVFDKFNEFIKNIRINGRSRNNSYNGSNYFSNLLLQKYQRKSKNWPGGADPQGFFYKRINKLNFKQIQKKQNIEAMTIQNDIESGNILNLQPNILKKLKNISGYKPVAELLWEVRTKHKIPEVLLIQQTLFFQKKLVRKSTEENNLVNQFSSTDQGLSQKVQTLLRKMTQRRSFRKHVFLETLFHWTRDAMSLRKMLRKIYLKNNWQTFFKYILKSKTRLVLSDYYSSWYKKTFSNTKNKYNLCISDSFNTNFKVNSQKIIKTENIRPFFYNFIQTRNNNKLFQSKSNINFVLKDFYKNVSIDLNLFKNRTHTIESVYNLHLKNKKIIYNKKSPILNFASLKEINYVSNNPLVFPEWKLFNNVALSETHTLKGIGPLKVCRDNIHCKSYFVKYDSLDPLSFILINKANNNPDHYLSNQLNSYNFINQQNLLKIGFPLYNISNHTLFKMVNTNNNNSFVNIKKKVDREPTQFHLSFPFSFTFNNTHTFKGPIPFNVNESPSQIELQSEHLKSFFNSNLSNIFNRYLDYKKVQYKNSNKFFEIKNNLNLFDLLQRKLLEKNEIKSQLNFYSKQLSIRNRLLYQKLYFTNILWHSTDFVLNTNSIIFTENQIIKNVIKQNWIFQTRPIYAQNFFDRELNFNLNNLLATLSTWQSKFEIKRDLILQIFYIYLDHAGAFLNYIIKNLILNNIVNQIQNWNLFKNSQILITKESIKQDEFLFHLEKDFLTKPTWSFDLLNHIKTQYPHLRNQIQIINQSNFNNIQTFNTLIKTPEFQSKTQLNFSPNFKTQLLLIESFRKNSGKNLGFFKNYNMLSNIYTNSINFQFIDQSIINKLSSQSLIIRNSTLFCQKWIENRQLSHFYKIQFLKKQRKLRQILNILKLKNDQIKHNYITTFYNNNKANLNVNRKDQKKIINFKRRSGFLFTRSLITRNFNSFSSFSKVTRASISVYLNKNSENLSVQNFIFVIQMLLLHVCLIFCLITVYQSAFHFCLKSFISIFVILIHYFLNIKYRFKRLIKYVYQSTAQSFITNFQEYFYSVDSLPRKLFVFFNNLSTVIFSNKFYIWGKIYNSSIPSFTNFLLKNPFSNSYNFEQIQFIKSKNVVNLKKDLILSEPSKINKFNNLKSFFYNVERNQILNRNELSGDLKFDLIPKINLLKIIRQKKENNRMSLLRNTNIIQKANFGKLKNDIFLISNQLKLEKSTSSDLPWEKENLNKIDLLKKVIKNKKIIEIKNKDSSIFKLSFKLLKWNLGLILLIGESEIFAELEPYREMHWYFLKRLPIFLRSNTSSEDPINMYDYQADEKLRKFKEQFKKSTEIFQKRQNTIERKTERNRKKENVDDIERTEILNNSQIQNFEHIQLYRFNKNHSLKKQKQINSDNIILVIKSEKSLKEKSIPIPLKVCVLYINKITYFLNNFYFLRKKISRGQPFWKPLFSFLAYTLFVSRLAKLNRQFRDSILIINYVWIPFGPLTSILSSFLWKNWILNFSTLSNNQNVLLTKLQTSTKNYKTKKLLNSSYNLNKLEFSAILEAQYNLTEKNNLKTVSSYCSPFKVNTFSSNKITRFESEQFSYEIQKIWENINAHNTRFSQLSPPLLNRVFLWNFVKFEKKYKRAVLKWSNRDTYNRIDLFDFITFSSNNTNSKIYKNSINIMNKYQSLYIKNQERSAQNRYIHYKTYDPKVRLYRFYTNFSKNFHDIGIIQDAKNVHPLFGSLLCEIYSGLLSSSTKNKTQLSFFSSTKNILLVGNTNSANFVLLVQAFAAETGLKLFMEDAKRLRRLGRRGINKSTKRLEKLFEIAQAHSPCIVFLEDIDVIGSKRRVIKINEEEEDEDMAIRSFFSRLIYRKQHNYKSLSQSFIHQNLFISNEETYRNTQKSIIPESPIPSNLIKYQLTRRKAFSNYFSNTSNSSYKSFITKFNALKKVSSINGNFSNNVSSSPTNTVIIWKLLKSKLVTPKKTIKETPWKHIPVDSMRSIPLITYSIRVKVAKLTMLAIYTMNTQLRLVKDLIKLLEKIQYESYKGFIVFATTNKLAILDPSLRRPGRFDETVYLPSLTVNPNYQRFSAIHFLNVLSVDSQDFVNFSRTFNILNSMNFAIDWNLNSVYGNVFIQDNSEKIFYPTRTSLRDLINSTAENVYNQNIFIQNENNIYQNIIPFDIWNNIGFQKPSFSIYSKSALLLSLAYSKAGQLIIKLFFQEKDHKDSYNCMCKVNNSKKLYNQIAFNSENNQLTIWPNSHIFTHFKKINISYNSRNKNIKNFLINYFAGKIGEFCFFSFYKNTQKNGIYFQQIQMYSDKKTKINHLFEKNSFGLRSLYGIQPNWKNINAIIFSLIRMSCLYSKNHLTSKLFYLDDIFKKRQRIFSENFGPSLLFEYFNLNTDSFLKRNTIPLEEHLQKQQTQKYLLNLQQKPLRKFLFDSTSIKISKNASYFNKISNQTIISTKDEKTKIKNSQRLALFRILFNELGSLDLITLRPTAMNYYYDKKISSKQRFRKHTYKWWNWHLKKTIDSLEEFQYLDFFPYADKQYNPRRQRWMLTNGYSAYWLAQEKILYYQIYEQLIIECFQISYLRLDQHREMLDYLVQLLMTKQLLTEIQWILFFKRFV